MYCRQVVGEQVVSGGDFDLSLNQDNEEEVPFSTFALLMRYLSHRLGYQEIKYVACRGAGRFLCRDMVLCRLLFGVINKSGTGLLSLPEFMRLPKALSLRFTPLVEPRAGSFNQLSWAECTSTTCSRSMAGSLSCVHAGCQTCTPSHSR